MKKPIEASLNAFLTNPHFKVAVLKGEWGIGKTFFWSKYFNDHKKDFEFKAYSYISFFGATQISDLESQIFGNIEVLDENGISKHLAKVGSLTKILKLVDLPYVNSPSAVTDFIESKLVENFLICFDDLERKEKSISGSSVLGLVSKLRDQKNCKILLIYNEDQLDQETKDSVNEYREKVVDLEFTYSPTIEENLAIVWPEGGSILNREVFESFELNNVRIMQQVRWAQEYFENDVRGKFPNIVEDFLRQTALLTVFYHGFSARFTLEEVLKRSYLSVAASNDEKEKERYSVISKVQFAPAEYDAVISEYLRNGYVDIGRHEQLLKKCNEKEHHQGIRQKHYELFGRYHSNFVCSQDELVHELVNFLKRNFRDIYIGDVFETVDFVKSLDPRLDLSELEENAIELYLTKLGPIKELSFDGFRLKAEHIAKIRAKLPGRTIPYTLSELLVSLAGSNGWNSDQLKFLEPFSERDFFEWITNESRDDVIKILATFLRRFAGQSDAKASIDRIHSALDQIRGRSELDKLRVERLIGYVSRSEGPAENP